MYKVRFNLSAGKNYMKWKVENLDDKSNEYLNPSEVMLTMTNCTLKNNRNRAEEINLGAHKSVCSWVICEAITIGEPEDIEGDHIRYNPRVLPYWTQNGEDVDGKEFKELKTTNKYIIYEKFC